MRTCTTHAPRHCFGAKRAQDYRAESVANHPGADQDLAELAIAGFDSFLYYDWPMTRLVIQASRMTLVHAPVLASRLQADIPGAAIRAVRLGHGEFLQEAELAEARARVRTQRQLSDDAVVFGVFGGLTPEKRVPQVLEAFESLLPYAPAAHLLLAGSAAEHYDVAADVQRRGLAARTTITGYLETDRELTECIAACDVALNLRWPTAREISGPWLRALAAGRPTVVMDLEHLADVPSLDPRTWTINKGRAGRPDVLPPEGASADRLPPEGGSYGLEGGSYASDLLGHRSRARAPGPESRVCRY